MDLELLETGNGGDIVKNVKDLSVINGFQNMAYLALFGGNPNNSTPVNRPKNTQMFDWWGNNLLFKDNPDFQFNSLTESTLMNVVLNSQGASQVEQAVNTDLAFMKEFADIEVSVSILSDDKLEIRVKIKQPDNEQNKDFVFIWDATKRELPSSVEREVSREDASNLVLLDVGVTSIGLSWDSAAVNFIVERSLTGVGAWVEIASTITNSYTDDNGGLGLIDGTTYYYRVRFEFSSVYSNIENATTLLPLEFSTNWNDATANDGAYSLTMSSTSTNYDWYIDDVLHTSASKSLSIAADEGVLDGTTKAIKIVSSDYDKITSLPFASKKLVSSIPSLSLLTGMQFLDLSNNSFTGSIPDLIALTLLSQVRLNGNSLTETIPDLDSFNSLYLFYAYDNLLTGNIPAVPSGGVFTFLDISGNSLTGYTASTLGNQLKTIFIDDNALTVSAINDFLVAIDTANYFSGYFDSSGGTNAAPTGAGATAKATLTGSKGWTVITN